MITFQCKPFDQLSTMELYEVLHLRDLVFVVGQEITAEPEVDGADPGFHHLVGRDEAGRVIATARLTLGREPVRVGRVAVHPDRQRSGTGTALMVEVQRLLGARAAVLNAQAHLEPWYARLGWRREGGAFLEAGIEHVRMVWPNARG